MTGIELQGLHFDPESPGVPAVDVTTWPAEYREAWQSPRMEVFRSALRLPGIAEVRPAILDDLSSFYGYSPEECVQRCLHWEEWSVQEWKAADRSSADDIADFYHTTQSWSFDLLWYAYLQSVGYAFPMSVAMADFALRKGVPEHAEHLDFGSGTGVTAQLFSRIGFHSTLADISTTLLEFAEYRLGRHGDDCDFIDLNGTTLPVDRYEVITAIDTLAHVPDFPKTVAELHAALKPDGLLFANLDVRPRTDENAWHLYEDEQPLVLAIARAGFEQIGQIDVYRVYRRIPKGSLRARYLAARFTVRSWAPARKAVRAVRRIVGRR